MNKKIFLVTIMGLTLCTTILQAQVRQIPKIVEEAFSQQYNGATSVDYKDQLVSVDVYFELNGEKMVAYYSNKGAWKGSEKEWSFDKLSEDVKLGFEKSKYADMEVEETKILYLPGGTEQYRIRVKKNDIEKKYLYFNMKGRLQRTAVAL